jgi:hypothetical protein
MVMFFIPFYKVHIYNMLHLHNGCGLCYAFSKSYVLTCGLSTHKGICVWQFYVNK